MEAMAQYGVHQAAATLRSLAANADNQAKTVKVQGVLAALVALLRNGSAEGKEQVAAAPY